MISDYRDHSGVRENINHPTDLLPILKKLGINNLIAHCELEFGPDLEERALSAGATDLVCGQWSDEKKNEVYSKYLE